MRYAGALVAVLLVGTGLSACAPSTAGPQPGETRIVADALGEAEIPVDPQRIVATDFFSSSVLVDVGVTPVGVMQGIEEPGSRPERYIDALAGVEQVSTYAEINVEKVLDLDPDLIIVDAAFPEPETLDRLAAIAPLFHVDLTGSWSERALSIADAANEREQAETQQRQYEERAAEISAEYRELLDAQPLAIVSLNTNDATWASYAPGGWPTPSWVDIDATFRTPTDGEAKTSDEWAWISDEQLEKLDNAGFIVVLEPDQLQRLTGNRVWESLPAVRTGNVFSGFDAPATSSFLWGLDSLDAITSVLDQVTEG
ncbi:ABC transporter substrate-binding protein [Leucobacter chromiireducens subsp. solipictus]|uniref:ABC transporter substrate-binding protein n=1 Tax=Leucobacter chromiireducens subsp. solipictus TaxID=398235 RepID=A0ABS1SD81_9MICO|nr:ABC transporter substrate-binding protein [Leucobacter chromiireducens subsp. solipictus]